MRSPESPPAAFSLQVRRCFGRQAAHYDQGALLQAAIAWRLAHLCRNLALPTGPCADLGAGSGLLARAIAQQRPDLELLRLDNCPELLAQGLSRAPGPALQWDLERGLPPQLAQAALLASNFALQWLEQPDRELQHWCQQLQPGGWLALAVPTAGSFAPWRAAAASAGVPFTGLGLPDAASLEAVAGQELALEAASIGKLIDALPLRLSFMESALVAISALRLPLPMRQPVLAAARVAGLQARGQHTAGPALGVGRWQR
jgi:malonyl-CoA O-methyltransferase